MPDAKNGLKRIDMLEMPDEWAAIRLRAPRTDLELDDSAPRVRSRSRRPVLTATLFVATIAVIGSALVGLSGLRSGNEATPASGEIVRYKLAGPPQPITVGEGAVWVHIGAGSDTTNGFVRIDAVTGAQRTIDVPEGDWSAVGGGYAWLLCESKACAGGSVLQIDPVSGDVVHSVKLPGRGVQIAGAPSGVWITTDEGVAFVDPGGVVTKTFPGSDFDLVGTDDSTVWVSDHQGVRGFDIANGQELDRISFGDVCTMEVASGTVWIASCDGGSHERSSTDELMGIDARTGHVLFRESLQGFGQMRYFEGVLYLAQNDPADPTHIRIEGFDPASGAQIGDPIEIPRGAPKPGGLIRGDSIYGPHVFFAVGEGSLWVTDFSSFEVIRVGAPAPSPAAT